MSSDDTKAADYLFAGSILGLLAANGWMLKNLMWMKLFRLCLGGFALPATVAINIAFGIYLYRKERGKLFIYLLVSLPITVTVNMLAFWGLAGVGDTEIWNSRVTHVEFTEPYVTVSESKDSNGKVTTSRTNHGPSWTLFTQAQEEVAIDESNWLAYLNRWCPSGNLTSRLNLSADEAAFGDRNGRAEIFTCTWPGTAETSVPTAVTHHTVNYIQASRYSTFNAGEVTEGYRNLLVPYPQVTYGEFGPVEFNRVLVADAVLPTGFAQQLDATLDKALEDLGGQRQVNIITYFVGSQQDRYFAKVVEAHFQGGGKNDLIVVVSLGTSGEILWVEPFALTDGNQFLIELRDKLQALKNVRSVTGEQFGNVIVQDVQSSFVRKPMEDFAYLGNSIRLPWYGYLLIIVVVPVWGLPTMFWVTIHDL